MRSALVPLLAACTGGDAAPPDAAPNSPPAITMLIADGVELTEYQTVNFEQGHGTLTARLVDGDADDTLFVRAFVDYNNPDPTPPRASCMTSQRECVLDLAGLCETTDINQTRLLQVLVFDREPIDNGRPLFQAMPPDGLSTSRTFFLRCQESSL